MSEPGRKSLFITGECPGRPCLPGGTSRVCPAHLGQGLEQGRAEPLQEGEGLGATGHLARRQAGHVGQQVGGQALEHLGLVEAKFAFGTERPQGSPGEGGQAALSSLHPRCLAWSSRGLVSVTEFIPEAQHRGSGPMSHGVSVAAFRASTCHGRAGPEFDTAA